MQTIDQLDSHRHLAALKKIESQNIVELFLEQVKKTPHLSAVKFGDQALTYEELLVRAELLATELVSCGVGPDQLVGICVERSLNMAVAVLGVLIAGGRMFRWTQCCHGNGSS